MPCLFIVIVARLPRLERGEIIRADNLDPDTVLLVVLTDLLESLQIHVLVCFAVSVGEHLSI